MHVRYTAGPEILPCEGLIRICAACFVDARAVAGQACATCAVQCPNGLSVVCVSRVAKMCRSLFKAHASDLEHYALCISWNVLVTDLCELIR